MHSFSPLCVTLLTYPVFLCACGDKPSPLTTLYPLSPLLFLMHPNQMMVNRTTEVYIQTHHHFIVLLSVTSDHLFQLLHPNVCLIWWGIMKHVRNYVPFIWMHAAGWCRTTHSCMADSERHCFVLIDHRDCWILVIDYLFYISVFLRYIRITDSELKHIFNKMSPLYLLLFFLCVTYSMCTSQHVDTIVSFSSLKHVVDL